MNRRQFTGAAIGGAIFAASVRAITIPRRAGELPINLPGGQTELLSKYRGRPVIVAFILST